MHAIHLFCHEAEVTMLKLEIWAKQLLVSLVRYRVTWLWHKFGPKSACNIGRHG